MFQTFGMLRRSGMAAKAITGATTRTSKFGFEKGYSTDSEDPQLKELLDYLESLKNYEKLGVPKGAGTDSDDGFDLGRMKRLLQRLGNPQNKYQAVHIAGTKGKGSTAAFISNILRAEGYSVGCYTSLLRKIVQVWHGGLGRGKSLAIHGLHDAFNPHLMTIRERFSFGRKGEPASAESLGDLFRHVRNILDQSIELENGSLTHFEILTALGFTLFGQENVDIAVVETGLGGARDATNVLCSKGLAASVITTIGEEHLAALGGSIESIAIAKSGIIKHGRPLVMGGPFEPHIEQIIRQKAASMSSPVVSASDPAVQSVVKALHRKTDKPYQSCDLLIQVEKDMQLFIELFDVRLHMLGRHQLQNAVTATCTALCLRNQGWKISDESVRIGLEHTYLPGRCQFLTQEEAEMVGLSEASVLIDGAHTEAAAKELADTIRMTCDEPLALVVAMASDKDHFSFARQLLSGTQVKVVVLTEVSIAGGKSRMTPAFLLKDAWIRAALGLGIEFLELGMGNNEKFLDCESALLAGAQKQKPILITAHETKSVKDSMNAAYSLLRARTEEQYGLVVVTGSLHIVSLVLASLHR